MLNIRKLISVSLQLNVWACEIIRDSLLNKNLKKYQKGFDDPVTEADFKIQSMLIKGFRCYFPSLKIIGEETKQYEGEIQFDFKKLNQDFLPPSIKINEQFPLEKVCLWIDPIDCTKGFINGRVNDVTVLIGLSYLGKAAVGIVATPFYKDNQQHIYNPSIIFGSIGSQQAYQYNPKQGTYHLLTIPPYDPNKQLTIVTSDTRPSLEQNKFIQVMKGMNILAGGSGRKLIMVVKRQADIMIYLDAYTHKWDTCACEAIVKAMGGFLITRHNQQIIYDPLNQDTNNKDGIICTLHKQIYQSTIEKVLKK